ncbi:hypothetical protein ISCGN_016917 [Ixodes scapularis]
MRTSKTSPAPKSVSPRLLKTTPREFSLSSFPSVLSPSHSSLALQVQPPHTPLIVPFAAARCTQHRGRTSPEAPQHPQASCCRRGRIPRSRTLGLPESNTHTEHKPTSAKGGFSLRCNCPRLPVPGVLPGEDSAASVFFADDSHGT